MRVAHEFGFEENVGVIDAAGEIELDTAGMKLFEKESGVFDLEVEGLSSPDWSLPTRLRTSRRSCSL